VDGGNSLQIWRVAANVGISRHGWLTRGGPPAWANNSSVKKQLVVKRYAGHQIWTDTLE